MSAIAANLYARLGNNLFIWAHAKKRAENEGHELRTQEWVGEKIFTLDGHECRRPDGTEIETLSGYFQSQKDLIYTRADCRRWFRLKPEVEERLDFGAPPVDNLMMAHLRRGDYAGAGYPLISSQSVYKAADKFGLTGPLMFVTDDKPHGEKNGELEMMQDFYYMMRAPVLFRGNSTFSYWAGVLGHGRVFSPIIAGLAGGVEHDNVPFVEGNWPKCADGLDFVTDLHLKEE